MVMPRLPRKLATIRGKTRLRSQIVGIGNHVNTRVIIGLQPSDFKIYRTDVDAIVKLRPNWYHADDDKGALKVVMTGNASEGPRVAEHARNKPRREALANRFRNAKDPFRVVIVRDMWLTGFDAPSLSTMYVDKPMRGHGLM